MFSNFGLCLDMPYVGTGNGIDGYAKDLGPEAVSNCG